MSVNSVALRGYGNGTVNGTVAGVATRGYIVGVIPTTLGLTSTIKPTHSLKSSV